jgi:glycosyltransferase involved in cell wall biosynthesis
MAELALRLPRDRFEVKFLLLTHRGPLAATVEAAGVRVRVLGWTGRHARLGHVRWGLDSLRFALAVRAGRYDILDAWLFHAYAIAALTRPLTRVPVLVAGRRCLSDFKAGYGPGYLVADALARRSANAIVANSTQVRDDVVAHERIDPSRIRVIRNGVDIPAPMSPDKRSALRGGWGFGPGDVVVGCVANYKPRKGLESLLRVIAELRPEVPTLRVVLVGEGVSRGLLERMVNNLGLTDTVRLHGPEPDARDLYGAFDMVVLASESEGLPNVLLEGAAASRAIVATAAGGSADLVINGETGLLVPVGDDEALARAMRQLAGDAALRERLGLAARQRAETLFGMDRFVAETAALYEELAGYRRAGRRRVVSAGGQFARK